MTTLIMILMLMSPAQLAADNLTCIGVPVETIGKNATIAHVIGLEGGFVNNPSDPGGATKYGITLTTFKRIEPTATVQDIRNLDITKATAIYAQLFWDEYSIDKMPIDVQDVVFDSYVQYSPHTATSIIQKAVNQLGQNVSVDGCMGEGTIQAINSVDAKALRSAILNQRKIYYQNLAASHPSQEQFLNGWLNRLEQLI